MPRPIRIGIAPSAILLLWIFALLATPAAAAPTAPVVLINEILASNRSGIRDADGDRADWLELHNPTTQPVSLAGFTLTDDPTNWTKWSLPAAELGPGGFILVWASGKDRAGPGPLHTNFRLGRDGDYLALIAPDGTVADAVAFGPQQQDVSLGRAADGSGRWASFRRPTPGALNASVPSAGAGAPSVQMAPPSGFYAGPVTVSLLPPLPQVQLRYTLDGSNPTVSGLPYDEPVALAQTAVVRAVALRDGLPVTPVVTHTYLVGPRDGSATLLPGLESRSDAAPSSPTGRRPPAPPLAQALAQHPFLERTALDTMLRVRSGTWSVDGDLVLPAGMGLVAGPDTTLLFAPGAVLLATGPLTFRGTPESPVVLAPQDDAWGGVIVSQAGATSTWEHVTVRHTSGVRRGEWEPLGGITFDRSPLRLANARIVGSSAEDGINVVRTEFDIRATEFSDVASDALDADFATGRIVDSRFERVGGDAIDLGSSEAEVQQVVLRQVQDKALSVGEQSTLAATALTIEHVGIALASKDQSSAEISQSTIQGARIAGLAAFIKKPSYGPAQIVARDIEFVETDRPTLAQTSSRITLDGEPVAEQAVDVEALYAAADPAALAGTAATAGLPVLSLVTDPGHLWDSEQGIHARSTERGRAWERPVTVQWLAADGGVGFSTDAGLRIHGTTAGRMGSPKQSFRLYFRGQYGPTKLRYPLFADSPVTEFDTLVLRAGTTDSWQCGQTCQGAVYFRDQLVRDLHREMGQLAPRGTWALLYLNGEYWGLYNLTERIDADFLTAHLDHDDWDLVTAGDEERTPASDAWNAFVDWIATADLSQKAVYEQAQSQLDIVNFTSFFLLRLWAQDADWGDNNWSVARMRDTPDARWRFLVWDADMTLGLSVGADWEEVPTLARALVDGGSVGSVMRSLLQSDQYRAYLAGQVDRILAGAFAPAFVRGRITALTQQVRPAIGPEADRWLDQRQRETVLAEWEEAIQRLQGFVEQRPVALRELSDPAALRVPPLLPIAAPVPLPPNTHIGFLVGNPAALGPGDAAARERLLARGATVDVIAGGQDRLAGSEASYDLILTSATSQEPPSDRAAAAAIPHIFWQPELLDSSHRPLTPWGGTRDYQTVIRGVDNTHPITAGLPIDELLPVVRRPERFSVAYPSPGPGVQLLARQMFDDYAILAAEQGAELAGGRTALARMVFLFLHADTFRSATGYGYRLFDQAVDWALASPSGDAPDRGSGTGT